MKTRIDKERQFWDSYANKYDTFIEKRAEEAYDSLFKMFAADTVQSKKLLEIATGTGLISLSLCKQVPSITATDLSPEMIKIAKTKAEKQSVKNVFFDVQDVCNLSFPGKSFDTIIASNVLHLLFKPDLALLEMKRVLTNKGKIIIPAYCHGQHLLSHCISRAMGFAGFKARSRWSEKSFKSFVEKNGFKIIKSKRLKGLIPLIYIVATPAINN
jgi:ubiquinone/menaquinone biosynthesis C-methylase UbiE